MKKKKVTLSLEEDVVNQAKKQSLNMSKAANKALREKTMIQELSEGEREFRQIMEEARENDSVISLPMRIERLEIKNIGKFESREFEFSSDDTAILGPNNSGKTTLIKALKAFFSSKEDELINFQEKSGEITVYTEEASGKIILNQNQSVKGKCLIIDDILSQLSEEKAIEAVNNLTEYSEQVILTTRRKSIAEEFENKVRLVSISENRLEELEKELNEKEEKLELKKSEYKEIEDKLDEIKEEQESYIAERREERELREKLENKEKEIEETKKELEKKHESLKTLKKQIEEESEEREIGRLEGKKEHKYEEIKKLENNLEELQDTKKELKKEIEYKEDKLTDDLENLNMEAERNQEKKARIKEEIEALREEKTHIETEIKEVQDKL